MKAGDKVWHVLDREMLEVDVEFIPEGADRDSDLCVSRTSRHDLYIARRRDCYTCELEALRALNLKLKNALAIKG